MTILVTGAGGYIGSHMVLRLIEEGENVCTLDNYATGFVWAINDGARKYTGDVGDYDCVNKLLQTEEINAVIHFAGSVIPSESFVNPLKYYKNNVVNTTNLLQACTDNGVDKIIFSSTAAVYGDVFNKPALEDLPLAPLTPYGRSKMMCEQIIRDVSKTNPLRHTILRYFNVAGSDPQGRIGQSTEGSTHLIKIAAETALDKRDSLEIFGTDYDTPDGTCVRDFIHIADLIEAHYLALQRLRTGAESLTINVGYGHGSSVRQVIETVKKLSGRDFKAIETGRREGDLAEVLADTSLAQATLNPTYRYDDLDAIVEHTLQWEKKLADMKSQSQRPS